MPSNLTGRIEHIVVVMLENRGFDTFLGYLYGKNDPPKHNIPRQPLNEGTPFFGLDFADTSTLTNSGTHSGVSISQGPVPVVRATNSTGWDPGEEYEHVNGQIFDIDATTSPPPGAPAKMTGFVRDYSKQCGGDAEAVRQIMHLYTPADLPVLSALARGYAVSDLWFSSVPTQTNANRAFSLCGTSDGLVDNGFLTTNRVDAGLANDRFNVPTLWNVLAGHPDLPRAQDWGIFWEDVYPPIFGDGKPYTRNLFPQLNGLPGVDAHFHKMADFYTMARAGTLPAFSYIEPSWGGYALGLSVMGNEYHPPSDVTPGEYFLRQIYTSLRAKATTWAKTLLLVLFDEHGGTYDHFPPPSGVSPPWGDNPSPRLPKGRQYDFDFKRLGVRTPAIAVSPLIEAETVFRSPRAVPFDHTSMIATVLEWMLPGVDRATWGLGERVNNAPTFDLVVTRDVPRTDDVLAPQPPASTIVHFGEPLTLQYKDTSSSITKAYSGVTSYYPTLSTGAPQTLDLRFGYGAVNDGDTVQIRTSEYLEPISTTLPVKFAGIRNFMGAWKDDSNCYYYSTDDSENYQQQYWTVARVGRRGGPICDGDQVQFVSPYWEGQVLCADGSYLTTKKGSSDYWTVHLSPAPRIVSLYAYTIAAGDSGHSHVYYYSLSPATPPNFERAPAPSFNVFAHPAAGTVPVHMFTIKMNDGVGTLVYYYSLNASPPSNFNGPYPAFHVYQSEQDGAVAVHLFTARASEGTQLYYYSSSHDQPPGFTDTGVAFWAPKRETASA
jgi:phospholipase C